MTLTKAEPQKAARRGREDRGERRAGEHAGAEEVISWMGGAITCNSGYPSGLWGLNPRGVAGRLITAGLGCFVGVQTVNKDLRKCPLLQVEDDENDIVLLQRALRGAGISNRIQVVHD